MNTLDWIVMLTTLLGIVSFGVWRTKSSNDLEGYLKGGNTMRWGTIGLSVMATQASAITFLSTPGQAFDSGMAFVQNYFGLPLAIIVVSVFFIPIFYRLKVYTAYEYLEGRFDLKTRLFTASLFLIQRGMGAGITIYAPAIILSKALAIDLNLTILAVGSLVIIYTVSGGTKAVSLTQKYQMLIIFAGMFTAFFILLSKMPEHLAFREALSIAGMSGRLEAVDFSFDLEKRYTFWSGITGGFFLALSYFGTDQSQVQRYLGATDTTQSRLGLLFNAVLKIPMQFFILFVGVMVFVFYQFEKPPLFFNDSELTEMRSEKKAKLDQIEEGYADWHEENKRLLEDYSYGNEAAKDKLEPRIRESVVKGKEIKEELKSEMLSINEDANTKDSDYVFITFVMRYLPHGIVGLLFAVIFSAAMSSTAGELNALASTSVIDFYKRFKKGKAKFSEVMTSRIITALWGLIAITFALMAQLVENLIEFVNIIGSIFYGPILGVFLVAFFLKKVKGTAVFVAAIMAQLTVLSLHFMTVNNIIELGYLWYNVIGCLELILIAFIIQGLSKNKA